MTEETKKTIKVDDIEYNIDDLTEAQKRALQHIAAFKVDGLGYEQLEEPKEEAQADSEK